MANLFKSYPSKNVGTSAASVYTCPPSTQTTIIGLSMANTTSSPITTDAYITRSAINYYLIEGATVPVGSALVIVGGDQKVVMQTGDVLYVLNSVASSGDAFCSLLEIT
jgi:hypothetical protein